VIYREITDFIMGKKWKNEELEFIKILYESGKTLNEVFNEFTNRFGDHRTEGAVWLAIKRHKFRHSKEQTREIKSKSRTGDKNPMFGKPSWSKGLTKRDCKSLESTSKKLSITRKQMYNDGLLNSSGEKNGMFGKDPWNKGESSESNSTVKRIGEKISEYRKQHWKSITQEQRDEIIGKLTAGANKKKNNTSIELIMKRALEELDISFIQQYRFSRFVFDFYLPYFNFVIECQGDYWHGNPEKFQTLNEVQLKNLERDRSKKEFLEKEKISYLFVWESEIHKKFEKLKELIISSIFYPR
jgi:G:T-mismatch repair DNA endonuclease (very short patch repair protein)